jgi:hypothetical protein
MRTLATPEAAEPWSLTSLREKLFKMGAKVISHGRYVPFQLAEVAVSYAREGHDALFVLPSYQIAVALPTDARILVIDLDKVPESTIAGRYAGRVPGHVVVLMPNNISDRSKGRALLSAFTDYALEAWERKTFAEMSVFFQ